MQRGLKERILPKLHEVMQDGIPRCDRELMRLIHCERRSVQRILAAMHSEGLLHIEGWMQAGSSYRYRPQYVLGAGEDVPHPPTKPRHSTPAVQKFRAKMSADDRDFAAARRRQKSRVIRRDPLVAAFFGSGGK
jgi:hypothetical protein